jgi:hypothetical protein
MNTIIANSTGVASVRLKISQLPAFPAAKALTVFVPRGKIKLSTDFRIPKGGAFSCRRSPTPFARRRGRLRHLGQALALSLLARGLPRGRLLLSHRGNPETAEKLRALGLSDCVRDNETLFSASRLVFVAVRPQDVGAFRGVPRGALKVSCAAGVPLSALGEDLRAAGLPRHDERTRYAARAKPAPRRCSPETRRFLPFCAKWA